MKLLDYNLAELTEVVRSFGAPVFRAKQLQEWLYRGAEAEDITNMPKNLLDKLKAEYIFQPVAIAEKLTSKDGTIKYLYKLSDGNLIEGVLMSYKYGCTLCVSTQVGCRMNCAFCASGIGGLVRDLTAGEILGQIIAASRDNPQLSINNSRPITNVVLMGSGEPLDNYDNIVKFLRLASELGISHRNISLSTSGLVDKINLLGREFKITLTISLHATTDEVRNNIMPVNKKYNIEKLMHTARRYFEDTGRRVIFEYALMEGVNDTDEDVERLVKLMRGFPCHLNIIGLNFVKEKNIKPSSKERIKKFIDELKKNNVSVTLRRSMGNDIAGACGQLRNQYVGQKQP